MRKERQFRACSLRRVRIERPSVLITACFEHNTRLYLTSMRQILASALIYLVTTVLVFTTIGAAQVQDNLVRMSGTGPLNVFKQPLSFFSNRPMTGYHRDGYCRTGAADFGNHAVAGIVTNEFLDFTASQGNDLRIAGLTEGCKWCLCTGRWLEAFKAYQDGRISKTAVPKVQLSATDESALRKVDLDTFKQFAAEESNGVNGAQ
jgi:uncharacterized protein